MGRAYAEDGVNGRAAVDELQKVTTLNPESYEGHRDLATVYLDLNEPAAAFCHCEAALAHGIRIDQDLLDALDEYR